MKPTTFHELARYARARAKKSARRNDPVAWAYWRGTADWASFNAAPAPQWQTLALDLVRQAGDCALNGEFERAARKYSRAKWLRILSVNGGKGNVKPLSLKWLKKFEGIK